MIKYGDAGLHRWSKWCCRSSGQARKQRSFHVARKPHPPFALVVALVGLKLISYVMSYFEFHMHRQIRRVDGTDTRINL